jgi:hypothetical protein
METRKPSRLAWIKSLRAEAGLLTLAGAILLGFGLPITVVLAFLAASPSAGLSPWVPLIAGGPLILVGYGVCAYAAQRLARAKTLESGAPAAPQKKQSKSAQNSERAAR